MLRAGCVSVGGRPRKASYVVRAGDVVDASIDAAASERERAPAARAEPLPLAVLYEDDEILAINKAPGVVVHPAPGHWQGTLVSAVLYYLGRPEGAGECVRPGIIHRLDKDTSGVLLVAKTEEAHAKLAAQFRARTVHKRYTAVVRGRMPRQEGCMDSPIGRHPRERKRMSVRAHRARAATTRYVVVRDHGIATVVHLFPATGRTHQLRVHLAAAGHPIVGDRLYGRARVRAGRERGILEETLAAFPRQALHAEVVAFRHPATGEPVVIEAPIREDMQALLDALEKQGGVASQGLDRRA